MTILEPLSLEGQKVIYRGDFVPGTSILRAKAAVGPFKSTAIKVSGLKGELWIESFRREVYLDISQKRVIKDELELSFGIKRNKKVFPVIGKKNIVKLSLVDECFLACSDTTKDILMADRNCSPDSSEL